MSNKISDKDKKDWQNFISDKSPVYNKDLETTKNSIIKSKTFDFHGFSLDEANKAIEKIIKDSFVKDIRKLVIITGKGIHSDNEKDPYKSKKLGILKHSLPEYIRNNLELHPFINELKEAKDEDGGSGAFYILLKKRK